MNILYAGDSRVGGAANYLLAVLRSLRARVMHIPPSGRLPANFGRRYDAVILSDFPRRHAPQGAQAAIARHVAAGRGLLMVGGWASFSGPSGGWRGSVVERLLPVACQGRDDRVHLPGGAVVSAVRRHPALRGVAFSQPPVICGLNAVRPRSDSAVLLQAAPVRWRVSGGQGRITAHANGATYPLLVVSARARTAALATDLAPHWCGGLVDWGRRRRSLPVAGAIRVEVGDQYVRFIAALVRWLCG